MFLGVLNPFLEPKNALESSQWCNQGSKKSKKCSIFLKITFCPFGDLQCIFLLQKWIQHTKKHIFRPLYYICDLKDDVFFQNSEKITYVTLDCRCDLGQPCRANLLRYARRALP